MNLLLIPLVFGIVLIAELPDKSMFASLVLGTRFRPRWVFLASRPRSLCTWSSPSPPAAC